jgi:hypothetical protein
MKDVYVGLFISFVFVSTLWIVQIFFRKIKTLCFCSTVSFALVVALETAADIFPNNGFLVNIWSLILFPGLRVVILFANPWIVVHHGKWFFLCYVFSVIFYAVVFWGIWEGILLARKKCFCSKTN